jgi:hypothetical protein
MSKSALCLLCVLLVAACQSSANPSSAPPPVVAPSTATAAVAPAALSAPISVSQALQLAPGSAVQVKGIYLGWTGPCAGRPPTRSAWQLADSSDPSAPCLYVDGPAVRNVQPNAPPANLAVLVRGKLVVDGVLRYVKADSVEQL